MEFTSTQLTSIIVAVITGVFSLLGAVYQARLIYKATIKNKSRVKSGRDGQSTGHPASLPEKTRHLKDIILFIACTGCFVMLFGFVASKYYRPHLDVASLQDGQKLHGLYNLNGSYRNIDEEKFVIWVVVHSPNEGLYFPQDKPADMEVQDQIWDNQNTVIGSEDQRGDKFYIMIYLVKKDSAAFRTLNTYAHSVNNQGLAVLPEGILLMKKYFVFRN